MQHIRTAQIILTVALVFVFGFFGIDKFIDPQAWIAWIPTWMDGLLGMDAGQWLQLIGAFEILCCILLLIPIPTLRRTGAALMALQLLSILPIAGVGDIAVRDIGLMLSAVALTFLI